MGYTHYWTLVKNTTENLDMFKKAIPTLADILNRYRSVVRYECNDIRPPMITDDGIIRFNGIDEDGHETFLFKMNAEWNFCETARKPYDIVVCEILLVLKAYFPEMTISSDGFGGVTPEGFLDGTWNDAINNVEGNYNISVRKVIEKRRKTGYYDCTYIHCSLPVLNKKDGTEKKIEWFTVPSHSDPSVNYKIAKLKDGSLICTCKGFEHRETCRHVRELAARLK